MYNENDRIYPNGEPNNNSAADKNENINTESEMSASGSQTESFSNEPEKSGSYSDIIKILTIQLRNTPTVRPGSIHMV